MHFTEWKEHDGYCESKLSLREGTTVIVNVRAVKTGAGFYRPVVRDAATGIILKEGPVFSDSRIPSITKLAAEQMGLELFR